MLDWEAEPAKWGRQIVPALEVCPGPTEASPACSWWLATAGAAAKGSSRGLALVGTAESKRGAVAWSQGKDRMGTRRLHSFLRRRTSLGQQLLPPDSLCWSSTSRSKQGALSLTEWAQGPALPQIAFTSKVTSPKTRRHHSGPEGAAAAVAGCPRVPAQR